jgi:peptidoglycan hydrolase-like protein with peptidoglycan-binding domain
VVPDGQAEVATAQSRLRELDLYLGPVNGQFDEQTRAGVREFQSDVGVTGDPSGVLGRSTLTALDAAGTRPILQLGSQGQDVIRLQEALAVALSRPLPATGTFGPQSRQALLDYQSSRALAATGIVSDATWAALQRGD